MLIIMPLCIPLEGTHPIPATRSWAFSPTSAIKAQTLVVPASTAEIIFFLLINLLLFVPVSNLRDLLH
jgi:hypothetical protein